MSGHPQANARVLIIDDDEKLNALLTDYLRGFGFDVTSARHPDDGLRRLRDTPPDLVILDVMLPGMDGFTVCRKIRESSVVPIIMLTARGEVADRVVGLEMGADDYLPKPFEPRELVARAQAVLRRGRADAPDERIVAGPLEVDPAMRTARRSGEPIDLTTAEFDLLLVLIRHRGRVLARDRIMSEMRGVDWEAYDRSVDVLVSRLRQKLGDPPRRPEWIRTVRGVGYAFIGGTP